MMLHHDSERSAGSAVEGMMGTRRERSQHPGTRASSIDGEASRPDIGAHKPQEPVEDPDPEPTSPVPVKEPDTPESGPPPGKPKS